MASNKANGHANGKTNGANGHQAGGEDFLLGFDHITFWVSAKEDQLLMLHTN